MTDAKAIRALDTWAHDNYGATWTCDDCACMLRQMSGTEGEEDEVNIDRRFEGKDAAQGRALAAKAIESGELYRKAAS